MRLRRLERVGADNRRAWVISVAVSPGGRARGVVADHTLPPLRLERIRAVAAEIARVAPERAVGVEILRGEEVNLERLDPLGRRAVSGGAQEVGGFAARAERADQPVLFGIPVDFRRRKRLDVLGIPPLLRGNGRRLRRAAADAWPSAAGTLLRSCGARHRRRRDQRDQRSGRALHSSDPRHSLPPVDDLAPGRAEGAIIWRGVVRVEV